jgi:predicted nucleic acid-binding protein
VSAFVLIDADFLSSFLKIGRLPLVIQFYQVHDVVITPAVYREVAQTTLLPALSELPWVRIEAPPVAATQRLRKLGEYTQLGAGEQESIALAADRADAVFLCSDNRARRFAQGLGIEVANIPAFVLACKLAGVLDRDEVRQIVDELGRLDYYRFREDVLVKLLG